MLRKEACVLRARCEGRSLMTVGWRWTAGSWLATARRFVVFPEVRPTLPGSGSMALAPGCEKRVRATAKAHARHTTRRVVYYRRFFISYPGNARSDRRTTQQHFVQNSILVHTWYLIRSGFKNDIYEYCTRTAAVAQTDCCCIVHTAVVMSEVSRQPSPKTKPPLF